MAVDVSELAWTHLFEANEGGHRWFLTVHYGPGRVVQLHQGPHHRLEPLPAATSCLQADGAGWVGDVVATSEGTLHLPPPSSPDTPATWTPPENRLARAPIPLRELDREQAELVDYGDHLSCTLGEHPAPPPDQARRKTVNRAYRLAVHGKSTATVRVHLGAWCGIGEWVYATAEDRGQAGRLALAALEEQLAELEVVRAELAAALDTPPLEGR